VFYAFIQTFPSSIEKLLFQFLNISKDIKEHDIPFRELGWMGNSRTESFKTEVTQYNAARNTMTLSFIFVGNFHEMLFRCVAAETRKMATAALMFSTH